MACRGLGPVDGGGTEEALGIELAADDGAVAWAVRQAASLSGWLRYGCVRQERSTMRCWASKGSQGDQRAAPVSPGSPVEYRALSAGLLGYRCPRAQCGNVKAAHVLVGGGRLLGGDRHLRRAADAVVMEIFSVAKAVSFRVGMMAFFFMVSVSMCLSASVAT